MALRKLHRGQPAGAIFQADAWNHLVDSARRGPPRPPPSTLDGAGENLAVPVRNDSGADVSRFGILGLGEPLYTPALNLDEFKNGVAFSGLEPDIDLHVGKFVICLDPIAEDQFGTGLLCGVTAVQLDVVDADHTHADIADTDITKLKTGLTGGAQILWKPTGTGTKWGFVRLGNRGSGEGIVGKTSTAITALSGSTPGSGSVVIYTFNGTTLSAGDTVTVYNNMTTSVDSGKWCQCKRVGAYLWIDVVDCAG